MTRFTLTQRESVDFVIESLEKMWGGELFIPKIPSYRIIDIAEAIAPECKHEIIGIRSGEKLHEEMITTTDALNTVEFENYFVIIPTSKYLEWEKETFIKESHSSPGTMCEYGFSYNSQTNTNFLSVDELQQLSRNFISS